MLATQIEVSDGTLNIVNVGIEFFEQADISVTLNQGSPLVLGVDYVWSAATTIQFLPTVGVPGGLVPPGTEVLLRRDTKNDEMYNIYDGGAPFNRISLDENFDQLLRLSQEFSEGLGLDGLRANLDMNGYRITELGGPLEPTDAVNREYVDAAITELLESGQGPQNSAANVLYSEPGGSVINLQQLADPEGADYIGFGTSNLGDTIRAIIATASYRVITPEQFGAAGNGDAAVDTACLVAAAAAVTDNSVLRCRGNYLVNGSTVIVPSRANYALDLIGATFRQQLNLSKTITLTTPTGVQVHGGRFYGRGGAAGEYNGASSSYNGVAALYVVGGTDVTVDGLVGRQHAGGCVVMMGTIVKTVKNCNIQGIGYPYIDPVGQGNQGNGSDFGIMCQPSDNSLGWVYEEYYLNNRIWDTAFGIQTVSTKVCHIIGNDIGPILGQHGVYGIENDGFLVHTNTFRQCYQGAVKTQFENYSGFNIGPAWVSGTSYVAGQNARFSSILWICVTPNSDVVFTSAKWVVDPRTFRKGTSIQGNIFEANGYDVLIVSSSLSDGREVYNRGASIKHNVSRGCVNNSLSIDRCVDADISHNDIDTCMYGIFARDLSGRVANNVVRSAGKNAIAASLYSHTRFIDNECTNCGLSGTADDNRAVVLTYAPTAAGIPSQVANPRVDFRNNGILFPTGDAAGAYLVFDADPRNRWNIIGTWGTTTTKKFRMDGSVTTQFNNHFAPNGYLNTAQNEPTFVLSNWSTNYNFDANGVTTDLMDVVATLLSTLGGKNVIRKTP